MKAIQLNIKMKEKILLPDFLTYVVYLQPLTTIVLFEQLGSVLLHLFHCACGPICNTQRRRCDIFPLFVIVVGPRSITVIKIHKQSEP